MFGLDADRRSTAPISSAMPPSREISTCSAAGSRVIDVPPEDERAGGAGLGAPAVGDPDRAVGLGDRRRARARAIGRVRAGRRGRSRSGPCAVARMATTSTGASGREKPLRCWWASWNAAADATVSSWLCPA